MTYKELDELYDLARLTYYGAKVSEEQVQRFVELLEKFKEERKCSGLDDNYYNTKRYGI